MSDKMLIQKYKTKLQLIISDENRDTEAAHEKADEILMELLDEAGFGEIAKVYDEIEKWYA